MNEGNWSGHIAWLCQRQHYSAVSGPTAGPSIVGAALAGLVFRAQEAAAAPVGRTDSDGRAAGHDEVRDFFNKRGD